MGVPKLYREIVKVYPYVEQQDIDNVYDIYFDFNGIIHNAAGKTASERGYNEKHHDAYEDAILLNVEERVDQHMQLVNPKKRVGFFIDGSAVKAKMRQQLQRRSKGPMEHDEREQLRLKLGYPLEGKQWNRNAITPGTVFMTKINKFLDKLAKKYSHLTVIISTSNEPGEGEHKLFNYLKRHRSNLHCDPDDLSKTQKIVIVGLDADLIMLSLVTHFQNIYLMRESTDRFKGAENVFAYADMALYRSLLIMKIRNLITSVDISTLYQQTESKQIIDDYVFMCFLLGNDFIPHSPTLSIGDDGINKLIELYVTVFNETEQHLVEITDRDNLDKITTKVNMKPVKKLIKLLALQEDNQMGKVYKKRCKLERYFPRNRTDNPSALDDAFHRLYYKPVCEIGTELNLRMDGTGNWKMKYYNNVLRIDRTIDNMNAICQNYLEGLSWVLGYYYTESHSWGWEYRYIAAPPFKDLVIYLNNYSKENDNYPIENQENIRMKPYKPFHQLMMVVPKSSANLLPLNLGKFMTGQTGDLGNFYPTTFKLNYFFHVCYWETEPIIPPIDEKKVEFVVNNVLLTNEENGRNSFSGMKIIEKKV
jgi:5'-3' exonuclease